MSITSLILLALGVGLNLIISVEELSRTKVKGTEYYFIHSSNDDYCIHLHYYDGNAHDKNFR